MTVKTGRKQAHGFQKGQSGNPNGRPQGARSSATMFAERLLQDDSGDIIKAIVAAAKKGDPTGMRICAERLMPVRKGCPVAFKLPPIRTASDIVEAFGGLTSAMASGELTTDEAGSVADILEKHRRAIETTEVEIRLQRLEEGVVRR